MDGRSIHNEIVATNTIIPDFRIYNCQRVIEGWEPHEHGTPHQS